MVLGEGGCGKSVALDQEHAQLDAAGLPVTWLDLGRDVFDLATAGTRLHQDLRTGLDERARFLLLDGLDEGLRDIPGLEGALLHHLGSPSEQERRGLRLRITCRTTRWPEGLDRGLRALWPLAGQVATMTLAPLPHSDIQMAVEQHGLDGGTFVAQVVGRGLEALAQQPVTLTWFGARGRSGMVYRSRMRNQGFGHEMFDGRPVIGIATRASELAPCNAHLTRVTEAVKRGVWRAGGLPLQFPTMATGETLMRSHRRAVPQPHGHGGRRADPADPLDGVLLLSGCDKTTPAMLMGAASVDLPAVLVTGVPMLNAKYRGQDVGSGTHVWKCEEDLKIGRMTEEEYFFAEGCMARSEGHCMTMGTASTMACVAEALGMQLPGSAAWPAVDSRQMETAQAAGQRIVRMVGEELCPSRILTREAFENAIRVNAAIGGSTNAVIHLTAIAGRVGVEQGLQDFDDSVRAVPTLVNLMPSGTYLMEHFCYAGGLPAVMAELLSGRLLHGEQITVTGRTIAENTEKAERVDSDVITGLDAPFLSAGTGIADLRGNLCPDGAVIKQSAASPHLLTHRGPARVFDSPEAYHEVADDPELDIDENTVIGIGNAGPKGS
ncbi:dihydroxy-acid dehydratase [Streptomyces phaeochromogenes]|uniref:dihydroxy-acid dehydratase n=1 Tax=Streptomyces phaeochromogenes TaxID=1923 RepID=UPI002E141124|nr:dihydroxy-acid dehydratase [Streptomyces phaeochromogenes]WSJ11248.1 dihydroxy-acid dehydratase [Streptomyces phaeochromogenes]